MLQSIKLGIPLPAPITQEVAEGRPFLCYEERRDEDPRRSGPTTSESRRKTKNLKMFFVDDGRRLLLSKQATAPHSEKIATECPKLKFSIEKIKKVNLSKKTRVCRSAKR